MSTWTPIGLLAEIPAQGARVVNTAAGDIAVFRTEDNRVFAVADRCPHKGGPLSDGLVYGHRVACPLHNWTIDLASGEAVAPDRGCVPRYAARVVAGKVELRLEPLPAAAESD